jgi:hypothetical protein
MMNCPMMAGQTQQGAMNCPMIQGQSGSPGMMPCPFRKLYLDIQVMQPS